MNFHFEINRLNYLIRTCMSQLSRKVSVSELIELPEYAMAFTVEDRMCVAFSHVKYVIHRCPPPDERCEAHRR